MTSVICAALAFFLIATSFTEVASWTIDLPEVRKYFFSRNKPENAFNPDPNFKPYDNIKGNSFHNTDEYNYAKYVKDYEVNKQNYDDNENYADVNQGIMERKVQDVVKKGSRYLEGLRRSLEQYAEVLTNCSRINFTSGIVPLIPTNIPPTLGPPPIASQPTNESSSLSAFIPDFNGTTDEVMRCRNATDKREYVRRMADLAIWATRRLEDKAYAAKYQEVDEKEQNEMLLLLAYYLDRIAHYTGYDPKVEDFLEEPTTVPPTTLPPFTLPFDNLPPETVQSLMDCLKNKSAVPATERCRVSFPIPEMVQQLLNITETTPMPPTVSDTIPDQSSLELLIAADTKAMEQLPPKATDTLTSVKSVWRRSINDSPLLKLMTYYAKHKVWINSNPLDIDETKKETFEVSNNLRQKRNVSYKKNMHFRVPENPMKPLLDHIRHKAGIHYVSNKIEADLVKKSLEKMRHVTSSDLKINPENWRPKRIKRTPLLIKKNKHFLIPAHPIRVLKEHIKKNVGLHYVNKNVEAKLLKDAIDKMKHTTSLTVRHNLKKVFKRNKRSIHYGKMVKPRVSQNPYQDISYYVKSREGTTYNRDPVQAAQVRLGLEQVFQTGNIEVVRRYGSNFDPLNPNPYYAGVLRTMADV